jgi:hypothetical protein
VSDDINAKPPLIANETIATLAALSNDETAFERLMVGHGALHLNRTMMR